jgi:hypothetical protein
MRRDGIRQRGTRDGMGLQKKNEAGWDQTGQEDAGHGTGRDDFLIVPRSSGTQCVLIIGIGGGTMSI